MKNASRHPPIGILAALPEEIEPFLEELQTGTLTAEGKESAHSSKSSPETDHKMGFRFHQGTYGGREAVVVCCGTGKVNAAVAAQILIDRFGVGSLLLSGIGGSLYPDARPGDIIIGTELIHHDVGFYYGKEDFISCGVRVWPHPDESGDGKTEEHGGTGAFPGSATSRLSNSPAPLLPQRVPVFHSDAGWVAAAFRAGEELRKKGLVVHSGPIVTGEHVVFSTDKKQWLRETFKALAVEMEGAAVAQTAYLNGLPVLIVRAISDHSDEKAMKNREIVEQLAQAVHPGTVIQNNPALRERLVLAARNAALLMKKAIEHHELP